MNGSSKRKYPWIIYYRFPGFGFSFDGDGKTIRARLKDAFERRNPFQRSNFFKIIEQRGDWLKIGIFFFFLNLSSVHFLKNWKFRSTFTKGKKIGPIRDGDLLLAKARRTVPVQYREKKERETIGECFEFMRSVQ